MMRADREPGAFCQVMNEIVDRAFAELDNGGAAAADEVVTVSRPADDVGWKPARLEQPVNNVHRCQDFEGPVNGCTANVRDEMDHLLGGKGPFLLEDHADDPSPGGCRSVTALAQTNEHGFDIGFDRGQSLGRHRPTVPH